MPAHDDWESFLGRPPLALDANEAGAELRGKRILVTGAGGSIGSALTRAIARLEPAQLVLLEASERNLYEIGTALRCGPASAVAVLGSTSQPSLLADIFGQYRPQIVYHAAAFKHVPLLERNPFSAIENNALGTHHLLQAAANGEAEQLILLSTDKAVDPGSIMGASKRIAELLLLTPHPPSLRPKAVRLGNVLASEGSIVPLFLTQIASGGPVTVTHLDVRRYFLTVADAVTLLLLASSATVGPGILVPELGEPMLVEALARHLIGSGAQVPIVFTQLRPGDKMCEALLSGRESYIGESGPPLRAVRSPALPPAILNEVLQQLQRACRERSLQHLMEAVLRAVPEYRPSMVLAEAGAKTA